MNNTLKLQCKESGEPHPEGVHAAVCVDVIDLGLVESEFQGHRRLVNKVRLVFETEQKDHTGKNWTLSKTLTASLHPNARLTDLRGKWRGRPVLPGEALDLAKLIGGSCTLVVSHQQSFPGRTYARIEAISKPMRKLVPSGNYDPKLARQRIFEWRTQTMAGAIRHVRS